MVWLIDSGLAWARGRDRQQEDVEGSPTQSRMTPSIQLEPRKIGGWSRLGQRWRAPREGGAGSLSIPSNLPGRLSLTFSLFFCRFSISLKLTGIHFCFETFHSRLLFLSAVEKQRESLLLSLVLFFSLGVFNVLLSTSCFLDFFSNCCLFVSARMNFFPNSFFFFLFYSSSLLLPCFPFFFFFGGWYCIPVLRCGIRSTRGEYLWWMLDRSIYLINLLHMMFYID